MTLQKQVIFFTFVALFFTTVINAQVGIGTTTPDNSAALEIKSSNQGLLVPRMDSTARKNISSPANGLLVYDNSTATFWYYQNPNWVELKAIITDLEDRDGDTRIAVEVSNDEDIIEFVEKDTMRWRITNFTLEAMNTGGSLFIGENSGYQDDGTLNDNVFVGNNTGMINTSGYYNTFVGNDAGINTTTGHENSFFGKNAGFNNTTAEDNCFFGEQTGYSTTSGYYNSFFGAGAGYENVNGHQNAYFGLSAGYYNTSGSNNTALGYSANSADSNNYNTTAVGYNSECTGLNQVRIGNSSVNSIGGYANWTNVSDANFKKNVAEDVKGLNFIMKLRPVTYNLDIHSIDNFFAEHYNEIDTNNWPGRYDKENIRQTGFIAQEVEQAAKESGFEFSGVDAPDDGNDFYGLRYAEFVVPLVKAVQEQQGMISSQQKALEEQKRQIEQLKAENTALKTLQERIEILEMALKNSH